MQSRLLMVTGDRRDPPPIESLTVSWSCQLQVYCNILEKQRSEPACCLVSYAYVCTTSFSCSFHCQSSSLYNTCHLSTCLCRWYRSKSRQTFWDIFASCFLWFCRKFSLTKTKTTPQTVPLPYHEPKQHLKIPPWHQAPPV